MDNLIKKLDELLHSEIVFPDQLVKNMQVPGYEELKYSKKDGLLIAEFTYKNEFGGMILFRYTFDKNDKLQKAEIDEAGNLTVIFNRSEEIINTKAAVKRGFLASQKAG